MDVEEVETHNNVFYVLGGRSLLEVGRVGGTCLPETSEVLIGGAEAATGSAEALAVWPFCVKKPFRG